jgi:Universal stress protein family.
MDKRKAYIVILWDGSEQSENAFRHALLMRRKSEYSVLLVRVVKKRKFLESKLEFEAEVVSETERLKVVAEELGSKYGILPEFLIKLGDFKSCIKEVLEDYSCSIIVSPEEYSIHKGLTVNIVREFSSYGDIEVPMLVANHAPKSNNASIEVVVPMEYEPEFKDLIEWVISLSRRYGCNFNFIKPVLSDAQPKKELINNLYFTKQVLDDNHIVYGIKTASKEANFVDEIYSFGSSIDADYLLTTSLNYGLFRRNPKYADVPFIWVNPQKRRYRSFN